MFVNSWKKSGLSISKYCTENGLKSSSLHYWIRKAGKEKYRFASAGNFVKLEIPGAITTESKGYHWNPDLSGILRSV